MATLTAIEWDIIEARVGAIVSERGVHLQSRAFLYLVLDQFFPSRSSDFPAMITEGGNDLGVDAIEIIEHDERADVLLFQSKHRSSIKSTDKTINDGDILKLGAFLEGLFGKSERLATTGNLQLTECVRRIWHLHECGVICRYRIVLCTNGSGPSSTAAVLLDDLVERLHGVDYEFYGPRDLIRDISSEGRVRETGFLQVIGREAFERTDGDIRGVIASVDARSFVDLIRTSDGKSIKRHLFDDNLRVFLGSTGGYNADIIKTAVSPDGHLFWYLNNGITITCRDYSYNKGTSNPKIKIEDFQIVNGAQTSHSLLEASRKSPTAIENVVLMVRVYATSRDDIAERVAVATNSQARIQSRDLRANTPVLKKLEIAFLDKGYYFERKRNMHIDQDTKRRIDALKLGQILLSYYLREPDRAKADSDSIFGDRFSSIFHERLNIDELCNLVELYRLIEDMREDYINKKKTMPDASSDRHFLVYGHWFVLFATQLILSETGNPIPTGAEAKTLVADAISLVAKACSQPRAAAHYLMFRSPKIRDKVEAELRGKQMSIFDYIPESSSTL